MSHVLHACEWVYAHLEALGREARLLDLQPAAALQRAVSPCARAHTGKQRTLIGWIHSCATRTGPRRSAAVASGAVHAPRGRVCVSASGSARSDAGVGGGGSGLRAAASHARPAALASSAAPTGTLNSAGTLSSSSGFIAAWVVGRGAEDRAESLASAGQKICARSVPVRDGSVGDYIDKDRGVCGAARGTTRRPV
jgi:hypothetical protein